MAEVVLKVADVTKNFGGVMAVHDVARDSASLTLPPDEVTRRFDALQAKLVPLWHSIASLNQDEQTIVVVPSITLDMVNEPASVLQAYEERFLFLLLLLRQPNARMVYVTSRPILDSVIDYYLGLLPGVIHGHARARLHNPTPHDSTVPKRPGWRSAMSTAPKPPAEIPAMVRGPAGSVWLTHGTTSRTT